MISRSELRRRLEAYLGDIDQQHDQLITTKPQTGRLASTTDAEKLDAQATDAIGIASGLIMSLRCEALELRDLKSAEGDEFALVYESASRAVERETTKCFRIKDRLLTDAFRQRFKPDILDDNAYKYVAVGFELAAQKIREFLDAATE